MKYLFLLFASLYMFPNILFAYLDPGTGSLLLSSAVALLASILFFLKNIFYRFKRIIWGGGVNPLKSTKQNHAIVFYSEGKQYYNVFSPILDFLDSKHYPYTYLTSQQEDLNLHTQRAKIATHAQFEYIGSIDSNKAISRLNNLHADIVIMTTPQLHVLQIKRSKGVKHYCHIIHALSHLDTYEIFALDYFDSVLLNSALPIEFIRKVECVRGLKSKSLFIVGCTYADVLQAKLDNYRKLPKHKRFYFFEKTVAKTVLLAPSWGRESLLSKHGKDIITPFIDSDFCLIIRPHPQSFISESKFISSLQEYTKSYKNIVWDTNKDNIYALESADIMIGDFSGVMFDFVCLFEKPIIVPELHFNTIGYDLEDIYDEPWIKGVLHKIGIVFNPNDIRNIKQLITQVLHDNNTKEQFRENIANLKDELWAYRGFGGEMSAKAILEIEKDILESKLGENLKIHNQINTLNTLLIDTQNTDSITYIADCKSIADAYIMKDNISCVEQNISTKQSNATYSNLKECK